LRKSLANLLACSLCLTGGVNATGFTIGAIATHAQESNENIAQNSDEQTNIRVYQVAAPAVVSVQSERGSGSGSIIDPSGLVLTSAHVVRNSKKVTIILSDKRKIVGQVIASTRNPDLALIRLQNPGSLPSLSIASSNQIQVGQRAFAIGNPFGRFAGTLTTGIVSRIDSDRKLIQTDAALNPGNSGGPLLNSKGELIGVNTSIYTAANRDGNIGLGFAITADTVKEFVQAAQQGRISNSNATPTAKTLRFNGGELTESLGSGDEVLSDGSLFKIYQFQGRAGQRVTIEMRSTDIDPYMVLFDPAGDKIAEDDDSAGKKDARIDATLPANGTYTLYANSYEVGESGKFKLTARTNASNQSNQSNQPNLTAFNNRSGILLQRNGRLGTGSRVLAKDGSLFETFSFSGVAGQVVKITLSSGDFHPYLAVFSPDRKLLNENNGLPDRKNAALTVQLPQTGTYQVIANAYDRRGRGSYSLIVKRVR
jgi:S1-C subfamily serine protease